MIVQLLFLLTFTNRTTKTKHFVLQSDWEPLDGHLFFRTASSVNHQLIVDVLKLKFFLSSLGYKD